MKKQNQKIMIETNGRKIVKYLTEDNKLTTATYGNNTMDLAICADCANKEGITSAKKNEIESILEKGVGYYIYQNGELKCPVCGRTLKIAKTPEEYLNEEKENLHLIYRGTDYSCGFKFYSLSTRINPIEWEKVKEYFDYHTAGWSEYSDADFYCEGEPTGWLTTQPEKVETALNIKNTISNINKESAKAREKAEAEEKEKKNMKKEIISVFENNGVKPEKAEIRGIIWEKEDPKYPFNIYGGGHKFIITNDRIWFVRNNGADGDNWGLNNFETSGAGAIAVSVERDDSFESLIKKYCDDEEESSSSSNNSPEKNKNDIMKMELLNKKIEGSEEGTWYYADYYSSELELVIPRVRINENQYNNDDDVELTTSEIVTLGFDKHSLNREKTLDYIKSNDDKEAYKVCASEDDYWEGTKTDLLSLNVEDHLYWGSDLFFSLINVINERIENSNINFTDFITSVKNNIPLSVEDSVDEVVMENTTETVKEVNKMVNYIANAFSLQMLSETEGTIKYSEITDSEFDNIKEDAVSVVGHPDTANILNIACNRTNITLNKGDVLYVAQLTGGRLPEGATTLPEGFSFKYLKVEVL